MLGKKLGIDLGSTMVRLHVKGEGLLVDEPALVATASGDQARVVGMGSTALSAATERSVVLRSPVRDGELGDRLALEALLQHLLARAIGRQRIFKPDVMLSVAATMSGDDRRALMDVVARIGARTTYLIEAPLAAAIGAGLPVSSPRGHLVVEMGGGTTQVGVVALEGIVAVRVLRRGGVHLTHAIARHIERERGLVVPTAVAEDVKREIGSAVPLHEERTLAVTGEDRATGEPREIVLSSTEVLTVMTPQLRDTAQALREVLEETPAGLLADIRGEGGTVTGGAAQLRGCERLLASASGLPMRVAEDPQRCAIRGTAAALDNLEVLKRNFLYIR